MPSCFVVPGCGTAPGSGIVPDYMMPGRSENENACIFYFFKHKDFFFFVACDSRNNAFVHRPGAPLERHATERSEAVA